MTSSDADSIQIDAELVAECARVFSEAALAQERVIDVIVERVARVLNCFCIVLLPVLLADGSCVLDPVAHFDVDPERGRRRRAVADASRSSVDSDRPEARVFRTGEVLAFERASEEFLRSRYPEGEELERALANRPGPILLIPLRVQGEAIGVFALVGPSEQQAFSLPERRMATMLAAHAALSVRNAHLMGELERELEARKATQRALEQSESRLRQIFETADEGIWVTDAERRTVLVNRRMAELLGETQQSMLGGNAADYLAAADHVSSEKRLLRRKAGIAEQIEVRLRRRDGTSFDARVSVSSMLGPSGEYLGAVSLVTDATKQKDLEAQLRQSQRMEALGKLAGGIAHDFNNILSIILGLAHLAQEQLTPEHPARQDLEELCGAADRAAKLTSQILAFSRRQVLQPVVVEVNEVVERFLPMVRRVLGESVEVRSFLQQGVGCIRVDPSQLEQVLLNLAVNSRDAMPEGGRLTFETQRVVLDQEYVRQHVDSQLGPHVMIAVSDSGCGMDRGTQERIFEPFFTTKLVGKGTGLGLATVFGIVRQSGGNIWVYSEVGLGTTFKIYFPITEDRPTSTPPPRAQSAPVGISTVLLVEDDRALREVASSILTRAGHKVLAAGLPSEALALAAEFGGQIDLLITDVVMPEMNGLQLAQRLAQPRPGMRVLYMSGYTENTIVHDGVLDDGIAFLPKPITPDSLLSKLNQVLSPDAG